VTFDTATKTITGKFTLVGTTATAGHIHMGVAGANGAVIVTLTDSGSGVWTVPATVLTAAQAQTLLSGGMYFNFHNATYAGGEVRGQIGF
jgi:phage tail sheath gpL-like